MTDTSPNAEQLLKQARQLVKAGKFSEAQPLIASILKADPRNAEAWYTASLIISNEDKKRSALKRALSADPQHREAREALRRLEHKPASESIKSARPQNHSLPQPPDGKLANTFPRKDIRPILLAGGVLCGILLILFMGAVLLRSRGSLPVLFAPTATTPTKTTTPTITATPTERRTPTPGPISLTKLDGEAEAKLYSAPHEFLGQGHGDFTVNGPFVLNYSDGLLEVNMANEANSNEVWGFKFYSPNWIVGRTVQNAIGIGAKDKITSGINIDTQSRACDSVKGQFTLEQEYPVVIISFTHFCDGGALTGTLTLTPLSLLTPTPTVPSEQILTYPSGEGQIEATLYSAPGEFLGSGRGDFTLKGPARLTFDSGVLDIGQLNRVEPWGFSFSAPVIELGKTYENAVGFPMWPHFPIIRISVEDRGCNKDFGTFKIDKEASNLIVTFTHFCDNKSLLRGKITFIPSAALTLTPTVSPEKIFSPVPTTGEFKADLYSAPDDTIGEGVGNLQLKGPGEVTVFQGKMIFTIASASSRNTNWNFQFFGSQIHVGEEYPFAFDSDRTVPLMLVGTDQTSCRFGSGKFTIEQQAPTIVVSFSQMCNNFAGEVLKGRFTFTPLLALTPTPTVLPEKRFSPVASTGKLTAELFSAPGDPIGQGAGTLKFQEKADVRTSYGRVIFTTASGGDPNHAWVFDFFAPVIGVGQEYKVPMPGKATTIPNIRIDARGMGCSPLSGKFTVEQQAPLIVVSFSQVCWNDPNKELRGKITFIPDTPIAPTP